MRKASRGFVRVVAFVVVALLPAAGRAEVIDRILAVVERELITLSDVAAAVRLGLVDAPPPGADAVRAALDALIARQLELGEANRYQPPEPPPAEIQARLDAVRSRFRTQSAFEQALVQAGLSEEQLRLRLRDDLRIEAYLNQRFGVARQPSEQEVIEYYRAHAAEFSTAAGVRPFAEVRDDVRARVAATRRTTLVTEWLDGLRRRTEIADLYAVEK
jgi:peptidyl-prolyl cis-trans isomerase SurA